MGTDLFEVKSAGALWALDRLPTDPLPPDSSRRPAPEADLREVFTALPAHGHAGPERVLGPRRCALKALCSDWEWLRGHGPDPPPTGEPPTGPVDHRGEHLPEVGTEAELEDALKALHAAPREEALPERTALTCAHHGRHALAAVLNAEVLTGPAAWLAGHHPDLARERVLIDVAQDAQQVLMAERVPFRHVRSGSLPSIDPPTTPQHARPSRFTRVLPTGLRRPRTSRLPRTSRRRPRVVHGETSLTLPISIRRVLRGGLGFRVVSEVLLPKAEHSRTLTGPSVRDHRVGPTPGGGAERGVPGQLATIRWEGFSHAEDDLGNRYLILCEVEKGRPGLCRFLGSEMVTQTLFPALAFDAHRLFLTNPGHLITHVSTLDGRASGRPRTRTVPDGHVVTVELR